MERPDEIMQGNRPEEVILIYHAREGKAHRVDAYHVVRAGISWPGADSPGYICIFGLKDEPTISGKKVLFLLNESERTLVDKFFETMAIRANRYRCERIFANMENNYCFQDSFRRFVRDRKLDPPRLLDSTEFESLNHGVAVIKQRLKDGDLVMPKESILGRQVLTMTPDDLRDRPDERFYAVMALIRVIGSFEHYPWRKVPSAGAGFSNFSHRARNSWDGGYFESYGE